MGGSSLSRQVKISLPEFALVVLVGPAGAGKSTFAAASFKPTEVISSDFCRALVADDETDQSASAAAFQVLHLIARLRLRRRKLTVVDAVNSRPEDRAPLLELAREHDCAAVAVVFDVPEEVCVARDRLRGRTVGRRAIQAQRKDVVSSLDGLGKEGFAEVHVLDPMSAEPATVKRVPLPVNRRWERGPFDVIGDVHACSQELDQLLAELGYRPAPGEGVADSARVHPGGRKAVFVGDLVDRGPDTPGVLRRVMAMVAARSALCVVGNHDDKLRRALLGHPVKLAQGLAGSLRQLEAEPSLRDAACRFLAQLPSHYVLDGGGLVVAHAGIKSPMQGRDSPRIRRFTLYGETTGETDERGLPIRLDWARDYRGRAAVVYGHRPVLEPAWHRRTINVDTGCVFGGRLTALRYPELELVSVAARDQYAERQVGGDDVEDEAESAGKA
jgi:polynucleotide kinase-phosphatase